MKKNNLNKKISLQEAYKVVLIGESSVGKTCIISQFITGKFDKNTVTSITAQFIRKPFELSDGKEITFDIWDTAGQERYRNLAKVFYKDAKVVILVYDITNEKSFIEMRDYWYEQIKKTDNKDVIIAIAANKSDLYENRQVLDKTGREFAKKNAHIFMNTSASLGSGINSLFENIARKLIEPKFDFFKSESKKKKKFKRKKEKNLKKEREEVEKLKGNNNIVKMNYKKKDKFTLFGIECCCW